MANREWPTRTALPSATGPSARRISALQQCQIELAAVRAAGSSRTASRAEQSGGATQIGHVCICIHRCFHLNCPLIFSAPAVKMPAAGTRNRLAPSCRRPVAMRTEQRFTGHQTVCRTPLCKRVTKLSCSEHSAGSMALSQPL